MHCLHSTLHCLDFVAFKGLRLKAYLTNGEFFFSLTSDILYLIFQSLRRHYIMQKGYFYTSAIKLCNVKLIITLIEVLEALNSVWQEANGENARLEEEVAAHVQEKYLDPPLVTSRSRETEENTSKRGKHKNKNLVF